MDLPKPHTLKEISEILECDYLGDPGHIVTGINEIHVARPGDLVFSDHAKYHQKALDSEATTVLLNVLHEVPPGKGLLISDDPFSDFNKLTKLFRPFKASSSPIATSAAVGKGTVIQPNVFIGNDVVIGKNCLIHSNVSIYDGAVIGDNVIIHANAVIGSDAFYFKKRTNKHDKLVSGGNVVIGDDVEIGAGCTIDRGVSANTVIGSGSKLDNGIQIGHDTVIGKNCLFAAQVGIAGCVVIEDDVTLWGQVGVISGITIGKGVVVLAQSGISKSLEPNKTYFGSPAEEARKKYRELASVRILPEIIEKLDLPGT